MSKIISADLKAAAWRGFIRTAAQALASVIPTGAITITLSGSWLLGAGLAVANAVVTAALAGAASALSIVSKGIPGAYVAAGQTPTVTAAAPAATDSSV
jgi:hypothetical protein